jgi:hypothetical protein
MRPLAALLLGAALALAGGCGDTPSKSDCEKLLEHLIELEMRAGGGDGDLTDEMKAALDKQKKQVVEFAAGQKFVETCTRKTPKAVVECGLTARSTADLAACDEGS